MFLRDPDHQSDWYFSLIAYASLKLEEVDTVRKQKLEQRIDMVRFVLRCLGLPLGPFVVRTMQTFRAREGAVVLPELICTLQHDAGDFQLAYFDEARPSGPSSTTCRRPMPVLPEGASVPNYSYLATLRSLRTNCVADVELLSAFDGEATPAVETQATVEEQNRTCATHSAAQLKLSALTGQFREFLTHFEGPDWTTRVTEAGFSPVLRKLHTLRAEADNQDDTIAAKAESSARVHVWPPAWQGFYQTIQRVRQIAKQSCMRIVAFSDFGSKFLSWFTNQGFKPSPSFARWVARSELYKSQSEENPHREPFNECCQKLFRSRTRMGFLDIGDDSFSTWLLGTILHVYADLINRSPTEGNEEVWMNFANDTRLLADLLSKFMFQSVSCDVAQLTNIWSAGTQTGHVTSAKALATLARLKEPRMAPISEVLRNHKIGKEHMVPIDSLLMRSAQDDIADRRMQEVLDGLKHDSMLSISIDATARAIHIRNESLVWDSVEDVCAILTESYTQLYEAMQMWSDVRRLESVPRTNEFAAHVGQILIALDVVQWCSLWASCSDLLQDIAEITDEGTFVAARLKLQELKKKTWHTSALMTRRSLRS